MNTINTNPEKLEYLSDVLLYIMKGIQKDCLNLHYAIQNLHFGLDETTYTYLNRMLSNIAPEIENISKETIVLSSHMKEYAVRVRSIQSNIEIHVNNNVPSNEDNYFPPFPNYTSTKQLYQDYTINGRTAHVFDHPLDTGKNLVAEQGINDLNKQGTCSLVSCTNIMQMAGVKVSENEIVSYASKNNLCDSTGGTDSRFTEVSSILHHYGVETKTSFQETPETLAKIIENGHGVMISVDSGVLWNTPSMRFFSNVDHAVTVTSVARAPQSNKVIGFYICDTGRGCAQDSSRFVDIELMKKAHFNSKGHGIIYTQNIIR